MRTATKEVTITVTRDLRWSVARTLSDIVTKRLPGHRFGDLVTPADVELALFGVHHDLAGERCAFRASTGVRCPFDSSHHAGEFLSHQFAAGGNDR